MPFIEPFLLWGALAVVIPIAIHFWHQKQGKPLPWAATQWLTEAQQQQSRGLRFDNLLLLLLRCLLLIALAVLLARPLLNWFAQPPAVQRVHLVQPSPKVADNFRFELSEARKKDERVVWATPSLSPLTTEGGLPDAPASLNPLALQTAINQLDTKNTELHVYIGTSQSVADVPAITVPTRFRLHTIVDSASQPQAFLSVKGNRKLFLNRAGKLISSSSLDPSLKYQSAPAHTGPIKTLVSYRNAAERQTVKAALMALADVYTLDLALAENPKPDQSYDWVLTDHLPKKPAPQTLYIVSGGRESAQSNVIYSDEMLTPQTSDRVSTGQLPEWLGETLMRQYNLKIDSEPLSRFELNALFVPTTKPAPEQHTGIQQTLLLLFIVLLVVERWLALTKNA